MTCAGPGRPRARYALLVAAALAAGVVGYLGYLTYPRLGLPAASGGSLFVLAAAAGVASFFSPCSFPLLATVLARAPGLHGTPGGGRPSLLYAAALALGAAAFLLLVGTLIALAGTALFEGVTFTSTAGRLVRGLAGGLLLLLLGLVQVGRLRISFRRLEPAAHAFLRRQAGFRRRRPLPGYAIFGFGYVLAGFG